MPRHHARHAECSCKEGGKVFCFHGTYGPVKKTDSAENWGRKSRGDGAGKGQSRVYRGWSEVSFGQEHGEDRTIKTKSPLLTFVQ